jgi:hypothetical protein
MANEAQSSGGQAGGGGAGTVTSVSSGTDVTVDNTNPANPIVNVSSAFIARVSNLENNVYKVTYFESISATSGTITKPTGSTILADQFPGGIDALLSTISSSQPTGVNPVTAGGATVDVTSFDTAGNYVLTGTPSTYPVALIYVISIPALSWANLTIGNILEYDRMNYLSSALADGKILVGNSSGTAVAVIPSGDVTISNAGVNTIAANAVTYTKSYNGTQLALVTALKSIAGN